MEGGYHIKKLYSVGYITTDIIARIFILLLKFGNPDKFARHRNCVRVTYGADTRGQCTLASALTPDVDNDSRQRQGQAD